jgi:hypothetical protein
VTRLYLPATLHLLARLQQHGSLPVGDDVVVVDDEDEDVEYDALMTAAETAALLAAELDEGERRRVVVVAEVTTVRDSITLPEVVAVHADVEDLPPGAELEDIDDLGDLAWYATQEIPTLLSR